MLNPKNDMNNKLIFWLSFACHSRVCCSTSVKECLYRHRNTRFSSNPTITKRTTTIGGTFEGYSQTDNDVVHSPPRLVGNETEATIDVDVHRGDQRRHSEHHRQFTRTEDRICDNDDRQQLQVAKREAAEQRFDETESSRRGETDGHIRWNRKSGRLAETVYTDYSHGPQQQRPKATESSLTRTTGSCRMTSNQPVEVNRPPRKDDGVRNADISRGNEAAARIAVSSEQIPHQSASPKNAIVISPSAAATRRSKSVAPSGEFEEKIDGQRPIKSATVCSRSQLITGGGRDVNTASQTHDEEVGVVCVMRRLEKH